MNEYETKPQDLFLDILGLVERLHRRLLDVIKEQLDSKGMSALNPVQALLIHNISENDLTAGELKTRGYYQGSNVSYYLKKLVVMGFLYHVSSEHDRRAVRISLTDKGYEVREMVSTLYESHLNELMSDELMNMEDLKVLKRNLRNLERYWTDKLRFSF